MHTWMGTNEKSVTRCKSVPMREEIAGLQNFSKKALSNTLSKGAQIFMICQSIREVVKRFGNNHKYLITVQ